MSETGVLNANYVLARLKDVVRAAVRPALHARVRALGAEPQARLRRHALDIAKRLMDYGYHPPTIYFPLVVPEALMIEPTETETKETLDAFCDAMLAIAKERRRIPELLKQAPHNRPVRRLDEVRAAKHPIVKYAFEQHPEADGSRQAAASPRRQRAPRCAAAVSSPSSPRP
jgi:Glycine cleavage system protein P (pyridoxal-binding), C-terminal domain